MGSFQLPVNSIKLYVGCRYIQSSLFAGILQCERRGLHSSARRVNILLLRQAENQRLRAAVQDGRHAASKSDRRECRKPRAELRAGDICIVCLIEHRCCFLHISLGEFDGAGVALG